MTTKLYCYVDENGQGTEGQIFIVAVILTSQQRDHLLKLCEELEQVSGKGKTKWGKSRRPGRLEYLRRVIANEEFKEVLRYSVFRKTTDYDIATIHALAKAIRWHEPKEPYTTNITLMGLPNPSAGSIAGNCGRWVFPPANFKGW